jgi:hypothetical protein
MIGRAKIADKRARLASAKSLEADEARYNFYLIGA